MDEYRVETVVLEDQTLTLRDLPFQPGDAVEVIVLPRPVPSAERSGYPLQGTPIRYERPTDPVAEEDWQAAK
jgi:hypothetical protein